MDIMDNKSIGPCGNCNHAVCSMCAANRCTVRKSRYTNLPDVPNSFIDELESWAAIQEYNERVCRDEMYIKKISLDWKSLKGIINTYRNRDNK